MSDNNNGHKSIPERSAETSVLVARLSKMAMNDFVPYGELNEIAGRNVQEEAYHSLYSAIRIVERDYQIVVAVVPDQGVKRLDDAGISVLVRKKIRCGRRRFKKLLRTGTVARPEKMSNEERTELYTSLSVAGLLAHAAGKKVRMAIAHDVEMAQNKIGVAAVAGLLAQYRKDKEKGP